MVEISLGALILRNMIYYLTKVALNLAKTIPSSVKKDEVIRQFCLYFYIILCMPQRVEVQKVVK